MSSIAGYNLMIVSGAIDRPGARVVDISSMGIAGSTWRKFPAKSDPGQLVTICDYGSAAAANAAINNYKLLEGELVSVVDQLGVTYNNVMVIKVTTETRYAGTIVGGLGGIAGAAVLVIANWNLQVS
ncbi:MAG: hypothetical protein JEZ07_06510 [Phycisphaerae bacterium]|nr:hypothetical protein [Phycisphaerae bacterium]